MASKEERKNQHNYIIYRVINSDSTNTETIEIQESNLADGGKENLHINNSDNGIIKKPLSSTEQDLYKKERQAARCKKLVDMLTEKWCNDLYDEQEQQPKKQSRRSSNTNNNLLWERSLERGKDNTRKPPPAQPIRGNFWNHDDRTEEEIKDNTSDQAIHNNQRENTISRKSSREKKNIGKWKHDLYNEDEKYPKAEL